MIPRREFVHVVAGGVSAGLLSACATDLTAPHGEATSATRVDVRTFGAQGDSIADDTAALQAAVDSLPARGGTVTVPDGTYMVDAVTSLWLRSHVTLALSPGARLRAIANGRGRYAVVTAADAVGVSIRGGWIQGERDEHQGIDLANGMGISLLGCSDALIEDVLVTDCWGDGILLHPNGREECQRITVRRCRLDRNRRQGMSVVGCIGGLIEECVFSNTGGIAPESGIDFEPNRRDYVQDITIRRCLSTGNRGRGILIWNGGVAGITVVDNRCIGNGSDGILIGRSSGNRVEDNECIQNGRCGIWVWSDNSAFPAADNLLARNLCDRNAMAGIELAATGAGVVTGNRLQGNRASRNGAQGIALRHASRTDVIENDCRENAGAGVLVSGGAPEASLVRNHSEGNQAGIELDGGRGYVIQGNRCTRNRSHGLKAVASVECVLQDNLCDENSQAEHSAFDNIFLERAASGNMLVGNRCATGGQDGSRKTRYGVSINSSDCSANVLDGNDLTRGGSVAGLLDLGTSTTVR